MKETIVRLIERFPHQEEIIKALSKSDARFQDLLTDHHDLHRQISRGDAPPGSDLERRYRNLEEELIRLIQGHPLA